MKRFLVLSILLATLCSRGATPLYVGNHAGSAIGMSNVPQQQIVFVSSNGVYDVSEAWLTGIGTIQDALSATVNASSANGHYTNVLSNPRTLRNGNGVWLYWSTSDSIWVVYTSTNQPLVNLWLTPADSNLSGGTNGSNIATDTSWGDGGGSTYPNVGAFKTNLVPVASANTLATVGMLNQLATGTTNGLQSSTNFNLSQIFPGWLDGQERVPRRGFGESVGSENFSTNFISTAIIPSGALTNGFKWIKHDIETWKLTNGFGTEVRDPVTHLAWWNTNLFPDGPITYFKILKTNGLSPSLWYDSAWMNARYANAYLMVNDISNAVTWAKAAGVDINFRLDLGWQDETLNEFPKLLRAIQYSGNVSFQLGVGPFADPGSDSTNYNPFLFLYGGTVRIHGPSGDVGPDYAKIMAMLPVVETNGLWKYTMPGRSAFICRPYGNDNEGTNAAIMTAALRNEFEINFGNSGALSAFAVNQDLLAIQGDPACISSRIAMVTNGTYVLIGPLGTAYGPDYSLALFNTNTTTASFTLDFTKLNRWLSGSSYIIRNCMDGTQGSAASTLAVSLPATNAALYRLIGGTVANFTTGGFTWATNSTVPPGSATTIRAWMSVTNDGGKIGKVPVYY